MLMELDTDSEDEDLSVSQRSKRKASDFDLASENSATEDEDLSVSNSHARSRRLKRAHAASTHQGASQTRDTVPAELFKIRARDADLSQASENADLADATAGKTVKEKNEPTVSAKVHQVVAPEHKIGISRSSVLEALGNEEQERPSFSTPPLNPRKDILLGVGVSMRLWKCLVLIVPE